MARGIFVRSYMAGLCIGLLRYHGVDVRAVLAKLGMPEAAADDPNVPLALDALVALYDEAERITGDALVGIHAGITQRTATLNDYLLLNAPSPRAYVECLVRFSPLLTTTIRWSVDDTDDAECVRVSAEIPGEAPCLGRHANEGLLARMLLMLRLHSGEHACVARVELAHPAPKNVAALKDALGVDDIAFDCGRNSAFFRRSLLENVSPVADPALHNVLRGYAETQLAPLDVKKPFSSQVRQRLSLEIRERLPTLFSVAEGLGMSPRSVQAKLAEEGTSFATVLDDVREGLARQALSTEMSLWDIAVRLHYSDLSAFVRAFRRWTGTTPGRFRADAA